MTAPGAGASVTPDELERWAALCAAATPGPWETGQDEVYTLIGAGTACPFPMLIAESATPENAAFIAEARTALPRLLTALRAAEARIAKLEAYNQLCDDALTLCQDGAAHIITIDTTNARVTHNPYANAAAPVTLPTREDEGQ